jgi:hypothetical protein
MVGFPLVALCIVRWVSNNDERLRFSSPPTANLVLTKTVNRCTPTQKYLYRNALSKQKA